MTETERGYFFSHPGRCAVCEANVCFIANGPYFRNALKCDRCASAPRHRAIMHVLSTYFPNWRQLALHESSPGWDPVSQRLARECKQYTASQYDVSVPFGTRVDARRMPCKQYLSENLEAQTFADQQFDLVVTQDVFEHIFHPDKAVREIARTLRDGGATIMTVPLIRKQRPSRRRASLAGGMITHHEEPEYHGNPLGKDGALVTIDWGYDICGYLQHHSGLSFLMVSIDNIDLGIRADLNEVLIGFKMPVPNLG